MALVEVVSACATVALGASLHNEALRRCGYRPQERTLCRLLAARCDRVSSGLAVVVIAAAATMGNRPAAHNQVATARAFHNPAWRE